MKTLMVTPAFGRTYECSADALADWNKDLDFAYKGGYINRSDAERHTDFDYVQIVVGPQRSIFTPIKRNAAK